jgi:hypothetical protein
MRILRTSARLHTATRAFFKMPSLLTIDHFPDCHGIPEVGEITADFLFPEFAVTNTDPQFKIHRNGSIYQYFSITDLKDEIIVNLINGIPDDSFIQFYKLNSAEGIRNFFCLGKRIDYSFLRNSLTGSLKRFFRGADYISYILNTVSSSTAETLSSFIPGAARRDGRDRTMLIDSLVDNEFRGDGRVPSCPVKSNLSTLLTGKKRYSSLISAGSPEQVPCAGGALESFNHLLCINLISPSSEQREEYKTSGSDDLLGVKENLFEDFLFINTTWLLTSHESIEHLESLSSDFISKMHGIGFSTYIHSNSSRSQYISMFPGNSQYCDHYSIAGKNSAVEAIKNVFGY